MTNRIYILSLFTIALVSFTKQNGPLVKDSTEIIIKDSTEEVVIQVSGLVVTGDSLTPLPFATVYRSRDARGTMTDENGFFSLPTLEGDTLQFSSTGYVTRHAVINEGGDKNRISIVQAMSRDTVMISEALIYPWPSRERFRQK